MKKPFIVLKRASDVFGLVFCLALCLLALSLFNKEEDSLPAFADGSKESPKGLFALVETTFQGDN